MANFKEKLKNMINWQFIRLSWFDMKRDKTKTLFGISGIAISIFLLTAIGYINDTLSYNYIDTATTTVGSADIMVTKIIQPDLNFDPFFSQDIIDDQLQDIEGVEEFFPRIMVLVQTYSEKTEKNTSLELYGIDFEAEYENGHMGDLRIVDEEGEETGEIYDDEPRDGECVILWNVAVLFNVTKGDKILIEYENTQLNLTIEEICVQHQKFLQFETALIIVNLQQAQSFLDENGNINYIAGTIETPEFIYNARDLKTTTSKLLLISNRIQDRLDINIYSISMPKLSELEGAEFTLMSMTIAFWFILILSMIITGILINGILSTSIEERVREFGILRTVGGKKVFPVKMVIFEGFMLGLIGSSIGLIFGYSLTPAIIGEIFDVFFLESSDLSYVILPETLLTAFFIGTGVSLLVSLIPAFKTSRIELIKAITPFQTKEEGWEIKKEGSVNLKSFITGISVAMIGLIIFVLLPQIFLTGDLMLIISLFIGLLGAILVGFIFAALGVIPLIQRIFLAIISPFIKKYRSIVKISLKRNRRRNTSTIIMFAISFSFIFFITSRSQMQSENFSLNIRFQYGADLIITNQGTEENGVDVEMFEILKTLPGVKDAAYTLHNTFDLAAAISVIFDVGSGSSGSSGEDASQSIMDLIGFYASELQNKFQVKVADVAEFNEYDAGLIGINQSYIDLIDKDLLIWGSTQSSTSYSFSQLFANNTDIVMIGNNSYNVEPCIVAKSIASSIGIYEVGGLLKLSFYDPQNNTGIPVESALFRVVGISGGIPGYFQFRSNEMSVDGDGVMLSLDTYEKFMRIKDAGEYNMTIDKIFINLNDISDEGIKNMIDQINIQFTDKHFIVDDAASKINYMNQMSQRNSILMEIVLMFTVVICIFGLISSMYAIMLERKFEIGILRSMGLKARNVRNMFLIESMILMFSSGIIGTILGTLLAYLLQTNMALFTEMPIVFLLPLLTIIRVFIISISIGIIGTYLILRKLSKQTIMEIFRQTF
ncbi:MAG: ABC transporter permease [Promethearchaeota archaeon]